MTTVRAITTLPGVASDLDIPVQVFEEAVRAYDLLGEWLREDSVARYNADSELYPQGSARLGTVVRPIGRDDYDIDTVYRRDIKKSSTTQDTLFRELGEQLQAFIDNYPGDGPPPTLDAKPRCWTLSYAGGFHLDVLPAIPDGDAAHHNVRNHDDGIFITDRALRNWLPSNPRGYAAWFEERMGAEYTTLLLEEARKANVDVEDVPRHRVKTTLQRVVQILKRHRDVMFKTNPDDKPVSILITTLAALAHRGEGSVEEALAWIAVNMRQHIEKEDGEWTVSNPVRPDENFANKWNTNEARRDAFFDWLGVVEGVFGGLRSSSDVSDIVESLRSTRGSLPIASGTTSAAVAVPAAHREALRWEDRSRVGTVRLRCQRRTPSGDRSWIDSGTLSPKNSTLHFVADTDIAGSFDVYWQVVNTGLEASSCGGLRGEIFEAATAGVGGLRQKESTLYAGRHWIECFLVRDGVCVGRSREFFVNIE